MVQRRRPSVLHLGMHTPLAPQFVGHNWMHMKQLDARFERPDYGRLALNRSRALGRAVHINRTIPIFSANGTGICASPSSVPRRTLVVCQLGSKGRLC